MGGVHAPQGEFAPGLVVVAPAVEPKRKHGHRQQPLVQHGEEGGGGTSDGDGGEGEAQDAVKVGGQEGEPWFTCRFGKGLRLHRHAANRDVVRRKVAGQVARAILDCKPGAVAVVGGGLARVVAAVNPARNLPPRARFRGDPQVGGPGVEDDGKGLGGGADVDVAVVLMVGGVGGRKGKGRRVGDGAKNVDGGLCLSFLRLRPRATPITHTHTHAHTHTHTHLGIHEVGQLDRVPRRPRARRAVARGQRGVLPAQPGGGQPRGGQGDAVGGWGEVHGGGGRDRTGRQGGKKGERAHRCRRMVDGV